MAASFGMAHALGGSSNDATQYQLSMEKITTSLHNHYRVPVLDFKGTPLGIDIGFRPYLDMINLFIKNSSKKGIQNHHTWHTTSPCWTASQEFQVGTWAISFFSSSR